MFFKLSSIHMSQVLLNFSLGEVLCNFFTGAHNATHWPESGIIKVICLAINFLCIILVNRVCSVNETFGFI